MSQVKGMKLDMFSIEKTAKIIGDMSKDILNMDSDQAEIIEYGAINVMQTINAIIWVVILGCLGGTLYESLVFAISASLLRKYSGGGHASSPMRCAVMGGVIALILGLFTQNILIKLSMEVIICIVIIFMITVSIIIINKAPVDSIEKPIDDKSLKKKFKFKSLRLTFIYYVIIISLLIGQRYYGNFCLKTAISLMLGVVWQSITLTSIGIKFIKKIDYLFKIVCEHNKDEI